MATGSSNAQAQIDLHKDLAPRYAYRYSLPFSRLFQQDWHARMIALVPKGATQVLDLGCGTGFFLAELNQSYPRAVGLDISEDMLLVSRQYVPDARLVVGDAERLPFGDGSFDAVFCKGSLHHTRKHVDFLANCRRVLKPDGALIMHPGPMNRGVEIAGEVADRPNAVITEQVANGVAVRMAVLFLCAGGRPEELPA